jgi:hypothetical protein
MNERVRPRDPLEARRPGGGLGDPFSAPPAGLVGVSHGQYSQPMPVAGQTVRQVRARFGDIFDIDPESEAIVDGRDVDDEHVLVAGQMLVFRRKGGEKGAA